jgi:LysM repeat protein
MSQPDTAQARYGRERACPQCGTRVAQKATTCFFCGAVLNEMPRRRFSVPWADLFLFAAIGAVVAFWWLRPPSAPAGGGVAQLARQDAVQTPEKTAPTPDLLAMEVDLPATVTPMPTPAPSATLQPSPTLLAEPIRHTVVKGDTVDAIAKRYGADTKDIIQANSLSADGRLSIGKELIIPVAGPMGGPGPTATPSKDTLVYTVQSGDTISGIAQRLGSQIDWILQANKLKGTEVLRIGQPLTVPRAPATPTPAPTVEVIPVTPSPTPVPDLKAPALLTPADGAVLTGQDSVLLNWTSVGILKPDQWYVVTLKKNESNEAAVTWWTKGTTWRLGPEHRGATQAGVDFTWRVQVRAGSAEQPGDAASPASAERRFTWR